MEDKPGPAEPSQEVAGAFDRKGQFHLKRRALLAEAARVFMERGASRFSLTDVARNLNLTKGALYYYFKNKQEMLFECYAMSFDVADQSMARAVAGGGNAAQILQRYIYNYTLSGLGELHPTMPLRDMPLEASYSKRILERRNAVHRRLRELVASGIADGSIGPCNPIFAIAAISGAVTEALKIYNPAGPMSAQQIASQIAHQLAAGFALPGAAQTDSSTATNYGATP